MKNLKTLSRDEMKHIMAGGQPNPGRGGDCGHECTTSMDCGLCCTCGMGKCVDNGHCA